MPEKLVLPAFAPDRIMQAAAPAYLVPQLSAEQSEKAE